MSLKELGDVSYFRLNNEINRPVNGQIPLHKDQEAVKAFFTENVLPNTKQFDSILDKIAYLLEENYLEKEFLDQYSPEFIIKIDQFLKDQNFRFKSFMAAYKFYNQYALKTNDGAYYLESMEDRVLFNALYFAEGDEELALNLANEMIHLRYQPATPSFLNAGRARRGELVSCFLIQVTDDMNSIGRSINSALQLSRIGGGVGISLSNLREAGAPIKGYEGAASGVVPVMKLFEDSFSYSNQLGQRQGAGVVYLDVFHPDIISFLSTKKENADEKVRVKTLSLGITVPDKFYELARKTKICTSSAHTQLSWNTVCLIATLTSQKNTMNWWQTLAFVRQKSRHVTWKQKFPNSNKSLAIHMLSTSIQLTVATLLTAKLSCQTSVRKSFKFKRQAFLMIRKNT